MFDDVPSVPGAAPGFSGGINLSGDLVRRVLGMFQPPSRVDQLRERLLELELANAITGAAAAYTLVQFDVLCGARNDWVIAGDRGTGKTALSVAVAQAMSRALGWSLVVADVTPKIAAMVGARSMPFAQALQQQRCVVVVDEFRLRPKEQQQLWSSLALGRQQSRAMIATTQSLAAVDRDVFRQGPVLAWKSASLLSTAFEREELRPLCVIACKILAQLPKPGGTAVYSGGLWVGTDNGLPAGWSEDVSVLWR